MRLVSEHTVQKDEKGVEECNTSKKDTSTVCKLDVSKSECENHAGNERSKKSHYNEEFCKSFMECIQPKNLIKS